MRNTADSDARQKPATRFLYRAGPPWMIDVVIPLVLALATISTATIVCLDMLTERAFLPDLILLALVVWFDYLSLWRVAMRLECANGLLTCRSRFRHWAFPLAQVLRVRPARLDVGFQVVETRAEPGRLLVCVSKGFRPFAMALQQQQPEIEVRIGWVSSWLERMPWPSSFRRFDR